MNNTTELTDEKKNYLRVKCIDTAAKLTLPELEERVDMCIDIWLKHKDDTSYDTEELEFIAAEMARLSLRRKRNNSR